MDPRLQARSRRRPQIVPSSPKQWARLLAGAIVLVGVLAQTLGGCSLTPGLPAPTASATATVTTLPAATIPVTASPTREISAATAAPARTPAVPASPTAARPSATPANAAGIAIPTPLPGDRFPTITYSSLPPEAKETLRLMGRGGPFPYRQDGVVFENRERLLPLQASGYYHEYTVETPGSPDRGARRIIAGGQGELYYTADHYVSFKRVMP